MVLADIFVLSSVSVLVVVSAVKGKNLRLLLSLSVSFARADMIIT